MTLTSLLLLVWNKGGTSHLQVKNTLQSYKWLTQSEFWSLGVLGLEQVDFKCSRRKGIFFSWDSYLWALYAEQFCLQSAQRCFTHLFFNYFLPKNKPKAA